MKKVTTITMNDKEIRGALISQAFDNKTDARLPRYEYKIEINGVSVDGDRKNMVLDIQGLNLTLVQVKEYKL